MPGVRQHLVLRARRRREGAVRGPRGRPGRGRREEGGRAPSRELFGDLELAPQIARSSAPANARAWREDLFEAWRRFLERMAARYPLVLVLEDIHWADDGLLDFIEHVADWAQGPIMVVATARPELLERRPTWGGGKRNATVDLPRPALGTRTRRWSTTSCPATCPSSRTIVDRSEGNPLYTEEIVRMLIDRGAPRDRGLALGGRRDRSTTSRCRGRSRADRGAADGLPDEEKRAAGRRVVGRISGSAPSWRCRTSTRRGPRGAGAPAREGAHRAPRDLGLPRRARFSFRHLLLRDGAYESLPKCCARRSTRAWPDGRPSAPATGPRDRRAVAPTRSRRSSTATSSASTGERRTDLQRHRLPMDNGAAAGTRTIGPLATEPRATRWFREAGVSADALDLPPRRRAQLFKGLTSRASWSTGDGRRDRE